MTEMRLKAVLQQIISEKWHICPEKLHICLKTMTQTWLKLRCWINGLTHLCKKVQIQDFVRDRWKVLESSTFLQALTVTVNFFHLQLTFSIYSWLFSFTVNLFSQVLTVTVDFFHLQLTFFTGTDSYSQCFPFTANLFLQVLTVTVNLFYRCWQVHLPHCVQCITILIT